MSELKDRLLKQLETDYMVTGGMLMIKLQE